MTDAHRTVPGLLAARAVQEPDRVAVVLAGGDSLTFGQWHRRADAVAGALAGLGVARGDRVGLLLDETDWLDYVVAYCGVQRAGGVAVPLSARLPGARVSAMLELCGATGLVHGMGVPAPRSPGFHAEIGALAGSGAAAPQVPVRPDDLAQILFTSGTTGLPKGVSASHANVCYGYDPRMRRRPLAHSKHFLHAFPIGTNAAQTMLFNALVAEPAALTMPRFDAAELVRLVEAYRVGTVFLVPAMAIDLVNSGAHHGRDLSCVLLLGSTAAALPPAVAGALAKAFPAADVVNYYSSTEAAPAQTVMIFDPSHPDAVGQPDPDELAIADEDGRPLSTGEVGEVWLRSPTAPRAYYGDPDASATVFRDGWTRMGDLGYLDADGYLYLVDRDSDVVKSGAHKVSTLRVEAALYEHPAVAQAAVLGVPHPVLGTMVAAAVVLRTPTPEQQLRAFLAERLAPQEIPALVRSVQALPRNDSGKVLKRELRTLLAAPVPAAGPVDRSGAESTLADLWASVLRRRDIPADGHFFALGGDSLTASRLAAVAGTEFGVEVPASFAFDRPTLAAQAQWLSTARPAGARSRVTVDDARVPLSSLQEYFLRWIHETDPPRAVSAVAVALRVTEPLDLVALREAVRRLAARHDALRTVFPARDHALVLPECPPEVTTLAAQADPLAAVCAELERPFDLVRGPLFRVLTVPLGPQEQVLLLGVHHIVFDGWSMGILLRELGVLYAELVAARPYPLDPPPMRAAEVSAWARSRWPAAREHWHRTLAGAPRALAGAPGRRPADRYTGASLPLHVPARTAGVVRTIAAAHRATTYMGLLTCWVEVLRDWTGGSDIVVMSPVPGRTRPEFDAVIGCLVQSLLIRVDAGGAPGHDALLARVRSAVLDATEHQYYPYEEFSRAIPYPAWFRFESWGGDPAIPGLESTPYELPRELMFDWPLPPGETDLSVPELALTEHPDGSLAGWLVYNRRAYDRATVEDLAARLLAHLDRLEAP